MLISRRLSSSQRRQGWSLLPQEAGHSPSAEVTKGRLGTPGWKRITRRTRELFQSLPNPFWFKSVATCPCRWTAGIPGPGEKMTSAVIHWEADVQPVLGSAEVQPVWEGFAIAEALAGSRSPQLRVFCV